jgi:PIN domain nuclease of toxin-antitoxin system
VLIWFADDRVDDNARTAIEQATTVCVSAATVWEIEIKRAAGKLHAPPDLAGIVANHGFDPLPITFEHAVETGRLPLHHGDPFDRMLVAQARVEDLTLVTADERLQRYSVAVLSAALA